MTTKHFYYIKDTYYETFQDCNLMSNKAANETGSHNRPYFYCIKYNHLYWMIPISSQITKYRTLYQEKMKRYHNHFDGIRFGYVNGHERAFLIQNMCPVTEEYILKEYRVENNAHPVTINPKFAKEINALARKALRLYFDKGIKIILTDLDQILSKLSAAKNSKASVIPSK